VEKNIKIVALIKKRANLSLHLTLSGCAVCGQDNKTVAFDQVIKSVVYLEGEKPKLEQIKGMTCEIGFRRPGSGEFQLLTERVTGTGFFIRKGDSLFLATAAHVARNLLLRVRLIASDTSGYSKPYSLDNKVKWIFSEKADVAVSQVHDRLFISDFLHSALDIRFLTKTETFPVPELPLVVIGFPLGLGIQNKFSPLRRETHASSD
jgi:S1-C subfamily serine protease